MALLKINMLLWSAARFWVLHHLSFCTDESCKEVYSCGSLSLRFYFFPVISTMSIRLKDHLVYYLFTLWKKRCVGFFFDDRSWTATEECSCHPQCGFISEVKFEQTLEGRCRLLKSRNAVENSPLIPESEKVRHCSVEFCQCGRADVLILYKECLGCHQS